MTEMINMQFFKPFGIMKQKDLKQLSILSGIKYTNLDIKFIEDFLYNYLLNKKNDLNQLKFKNIMDDYAINKKEELHNLIIKYFFDLSKNIANEIQQEIDNKIYSNILFLKKYNEYISKSNLIKQSLNIISYCFETIDNKNIIPIYSSYIFYNNVINTKYNLKYLYNIFLEYLDKNNVSEFFSLLKISNYFYGFSNSLNLVNKEYYFNLEIENVIKNSNNIKNEIFIKNIVDYIDKQIILITKDNKCKDILKIVNDIIDFSNTGSKICDGIEFIINYYKKFLQRLYNYSNPEIEESILNIISYKNNPELYIKMKFCLKDIENSKILTKKIHNLDNNKIIFKSEKYKNINIQEIDKNICEYNLIRPYAWGEKSEICNLNLPVELSYFTDIFSSLFKKDNGEILKYKKFQYDYEKSNIDFELNIQNKIYTFKATLFQTAILIIIINNSNISAKTIAEILKLQQLKLMSIPLNSLITIGIIKRPSNIAANDPNITFSFNTEWQFDENEIDLIKQSNIIKEKINYMKTKQELNINNITLEEETILKTNIINYISNVKQANIDNILLNIKSNIQNINLILKKLIESKILIYTEEIKTYSIIIQEDSDSEEETY